MTEDQLNQLYGLLTEWVNEPDWDKQSSAWATLVEARRQVEIELHTKGMKLCESNC